MAKFPDLNDVIYTSPLGGNMRFKTIISDYDDQGRERRKRKWFFPKRDVILQYDKISLIDARTIFDFYEDRQGRYDAFTFFYTEVETHKNEYVNTRDGSTTLYNLPCRYSSARTIYLNNIEQTVTTDYTYSALGGTDGCDEIDFTTTGTIGDRITMDFTGQLKTKCRFKEDNLSFETIYNQVRNFGIELQGLLNDEE